VNSKQTIVLWLGLALIVVRAATGGQWTAIWSVFSKAPAAASTSSASGSSTHSSAESGETGSVVSV
jgi:hypothetical protein